MKTNNGLPKRLKLEVETLRNLQVVELEGVIGGLAAKASLSVGCNCETDSYNCSRKACPQ